MNLKPVLVALQVHALHAFVCPHLAEENIRWMPKGWKRGARKLSEMFSCDGSQGGEAKFKSETEDYLKDLEYPVTYFRADLLREEGEKVGWEVKRKSDYIEVDAVQEEGAVSRWNKKNPVRALKAKDRVISVNGVEGNATLMADEIKSRFNASLRVVRLNAEDRQVIESKKKEKQATKALKISPPIGLGIGLPEPAGTKVAVLHARNFDEFIAAQPLVLVMFYANWCGHCKEMQPDYTQAAEKLSQMRDLPKSVRLAKFDDGDEANRYFGAGSPERYNFTSYPSLVMFHNGMHEPFYGQHGANELAAHVAAVAKGLDIEEEVQKSLMKTRPMMYKKDVDPTVVLELEPENFDEHVVTNTEENNRVWIIFYYSDKCPFCKTLKPEYIKASKEVSSQLGDRVRFGVVNSRVFKPIAQRFGVTSYPWVSSVYAGQKVEDMAGLGGAESIINWANKIFKQSWTKDPKWSTEPIDSKATPGAGEMESGATTFNNTGSWREILGRRTWFFLHTYAAKFPDEPTEADKSSMRGLIASLGQNYPCPICRTHLQGKLMSSELGPVNAESRTSLALWVCKLHNMVNKDLGKPPHPCNSFQLDLTYLKSCGECSANTTAADEQSEEVTPWDYFEYLNQGSQPREKTKGARTDL